MIGFCVLRASASPGHNKPVQGAWEQSASGEEADRHLDFVMMTWKWKKSSCWKRCGVHRSCLPTHACAGKKSYFVNGRLIFRRHLKCRAQDARGSRRAYCFSKPLSNIAHLNSENILVVPTKPQAQELWDALPPSANATCGLGRPHLVRSIRTGRCVFHRVS